MGYAVCIEFQKKFNSINLKLKKSNEKLYDYLILNLYTLECEKGFKVKKIFLTTKSGTKVKYSTFESEEDVKVYKELLDLKVKQFSEKWDIEVNVDSE